jgi:filamentous hemagglutinin family protein
LYFAFSEGCTAMSHRQIASHLRVRVAAPAPAAAGHRPLLLAIALASGFPATAWAQPTGAQAIHGGATLGRQGANLVVTTQNGAGTRHSAINWQSFSIPGGSTTHFAQPDAASTSINRVLGGNPSAILGTLSSNGRLVLVNPAGIAVGAGAVVDTAGFTASTLRMGDADAIAGRLRFGDGSAAGPLRVDGRILAGSGDVVLIGTDVQAGAQAVIRSPQGATVLAAGQKVELTGRGLEGIRLEVQAPGNQAVNLGTLQGDAVGIFAGTLRHSGLVHASAATVQGGRVVLKAGSDALVDGTVTARAAERGGSIDVFGQRVGLLAGATLDASGAQGGGQVRVGGDYQGANAQVPNADRTYVDAAAAIRADAVQQGDGGRVIVWSDEVTRMHGQISARGGAQGGHGGFAEISGKQRLEFAGLADLRAPQGAMGTLLLDPMDVNIIRSDATTSTGTFPISDAPIGTKFEPTTSTGPVQLTDTQLNNQLAFGNVVVKTDSSVENQTGGQITVNADAVVRWTSGADLSFLADKGITLAGTIDAGSGGLHLRSLGGDITQPSTGLIAADRLVAQSSGALSLLGANRIGNLAGTASTGFFVKNAQTLHVGEVMTAHATLWGITAGNVRLETTAPTADIEVTDWITATSGSVVIDAGRSITGGGIFETQGGPAGSVFLHARGGDVVFDSIYAYGLDSGIAGGKVDVIASGSIRGIPGEVGDYFHIDASGGTGVAGGTGGQGGNVKLQFGGALGNGGIYAWGGDGGTGEGTNDGNGGAGGQGGTVAIQRTAGGDFLLADNYIAADGGWGGTAASAAGVGGSGGAGGSVLVKTGGKVVLASPYISAWGGSGGWGPSTGVYGAEGALGNLSITSSSVEVSSGSYFDVYANWTHAGVLDILANGSMGIEGNFSNTGQVNLFDGAWLDVYGGSFHNAGLLKAVSGTSHAALTQNTGTVEVAAGAALALPGFVSNAGLVKVDGTLELGPGYDPCTASLCEGPVLMAATTTVPAPGAFTNESTGALTGTGVISVDGGTGTIDNFGLIDPAGLGGIGTLTIEGNLVMADSSTMAVDIASPASHDLLVVTGTASTGGKYAASYAAGTAFPAGTSFKVLKAGTLDSTTAPASSSAELAVAPSGNDLLLTAVADYPVPAPAPAPVPGVITSEQLATQQTASQVVEFVQQFLDREEESREAGKDDIVLTDTACKPGA